MVGRDCPAAPSYKATVSKKQNIPQAIDRYRIAFD
jgi:hypothetical protein